MASVSVRETFDTAIGGAYDVIVAGGGASGLIAAVAASRLGARTLLLERQGCLGGTATTAYVAQYAGFYNGDTQAVRGIPSAIPARSTAPSSASSGPTAPGWPGCSAQRRLPPDVTAHGRWRIAWSDARLTENISILSDSC